MIEKLKNNKAFITHLDEGYENAIRRGLIFIDFASLVTPTSKIFIKPNLTYPTYRPGVMTNPQAVEAAIIALREYTPNLFIGDSDSGGYNRFSMDEVYRETGLDKLSKTYGVNVINLSHCERKTICFRYQKRDYALNLPRLLTDEIDLLVTMPVPKVHGNTGVSLTFKNQWGCIPEPNDRLHLHPYFQHVILEVNKAVKAKVAIIDGKYGLNENGPMRGKPIELNWLMVTNDIGAGARLSCELMQIRLEKIKHLRYAKELGFIPDRNEIEINDDLHLFFREKFILKRKLTDFPGFLAFHNSFLTYLAYFSPLAGMLHRLLYLFREPFYDYKRHSNHDHPSD